MPELDSGHSHSGKSFRSLKGTSEILAAAVLAVITLTSHHAFCGGKFCQLNQSCNVYGRGENDSRIPRLHETSAPPFSTKLSRGIILMIRLCPLLRFPFPELLKDRTASAFHTCVSLTLLVWWHSFLCNVISRRYMEGVNGLFFQIHEIYNFRSKKIEGYITVRCNLWFQFWKCVSWSTTFLAQRYGSF